MSASDGAGKREHCGEISPVDTPWSARVEGALAHGLAWNVKSDCG